MAKDEQDQDRITPDDKQERGGQTVTIEDIGPARKCLVIEVPGDRIAEQIESGYTQLKKDADVPGFRRGRVPQRLLERRFGAAIRDDVKGQLLSESYSQAIEDEKLNVIGEPDIKDLPDIVLPDSGPLTFKVEVEVTPDVKLPSLEDIAIEKTAVIEVTDADVDAEIEQYRERFGSMIAVDSAKVKKNDCLQADIRILDGEDTSDEAEEISVLEGSNVVIPGDSREDKGYVAGIVVDDLGTKLKGKQVGDVVSIFMTGPSGHEDEKIRNQPITIQIGITSIQRLEPASSDTVVAKAGFESMDGLKSQLREMLESRQTREQKNDLHEQIAQHLVDQVELELPEAMTSRQAQRLLQRKAMELAYVGASEQHIDQQMAEMRATSEVDARSQLKKFFILAKAAEHLGVEVAEAEVNGRIAMLAMQQGRRPEKLRQQMQRNNEIEYLYIQMREQKTLDQILDKAKIKDVKPIKAIESKVAKPSTTQKKKTTKKTKKKTSSKSTAAKKKVDK